MVDVVNSCCHGCRCRGRADLQKQRSRTFWWHRRSATEYSPLKELIGLGDQLRWHVEKSKSLSRRGSAACIGIRRGLMIIFVPRLSRHRDLSRTLDRELTKSSSLV